MKYFRGPQGRRRLLIIGGAIAGLLVLIWYVKTHQSSTTSPTNTSGIAGSGNGVGGGGWGGVIDVIAQSTPSSAGSVGHSWGGTSNWPGFTGHQIQPTPGVPLVTPVSPKGVFYNYQTYNPAVTHLPQVDAGTRNGKAAR